MKKFLLSAIAIACMFCAFPVAAQEGLTAEKTTTVTVVEKKAAPTPVVAKSDTNLTAEEQEILNRVNAERVRRGLAPASVDPVLLVRARAHARWMAATRRMVHSAGAWENIAMGQSSPTGAMNTWMNSSGHRNNLLSPRAVRIGIGAYGTYYCQQFAQGPIQQAPTATVVKTAPTAGTCAQGQACATSGSYGLGKGRLKALLGKLRNRGC